MITADSLLRYHLSPHSSDAIWIGLLAQECSETADDFNFDSTWSGCVTEDSTHADLLWGSYRCPW